MNDIKAHALTLAAFAVLIAGGLGALKLGMNPTQAVMFLSALGAAAYRMDPPGAPPAVKS